MSNQVSLIKCSSCGNSVREDAVACPHCGSHSFNGNNFVKGVFGFLFFLFFIGFCAAQNENSNNDAIAYSPEPIFVTESCRKLESLFGASSKLSSLQKEESWKEYKGKAFKWKLRVSEVSKNHLDDNFSVSYLCMNSDSIIVDVTVEYPQHLKDFVLNLNKGQTVEVTGVLNSYSSYLGLSASNLEYIQSENDSRHPSNKK